MVMTVEDVEKLKYLYPNHRIELRDGAVVIMSPSDATSSLIGARFSRLLGNWVEPRALGYVFDASAGFRSPDGNLTAPDVSFVSRERLKRVPRTYAQVVPNLVVEIKSGSDRVKPIVQKLQSYLEVGAVVGLLVDPDERTVTVYRTGQEPIELSDDDTLTVPELLPGGEIVVSQLWPPEFD
ncbi:MAG: Uma2 family endonuclease [Gemmatimonadaceae bacterium]|nr:Uma2 family endonuclease [Gloeobacterales cyanobacterium ES-bin-141]